MVKVLIKKRRDPPEIFEGQNHKRRKIDSRIKLQCGRILEKLMTHQLAWAFLEPVDPVALCIPDYFDVISNPMDLGTVKAKLENNNYFDAEEFAADIRLTFSNAMLYNPPKNKFHLMAKELDNVFRRSWKSMDLNLVHQSKSVSKNVKQGFIVTDGARQACQDLKLVHQSKSVKQGFIATDKARNACHSLVPMCVIGACGSCGGMTCKCRPRNDSSKRPHGQDHGISKRDSEAKGKPKSQIRKSDGHSDGAQSTLDAGDYFCSPPSSTSATTAGSLEEWTLFIDVQLSPKKALRAAALKSRFADVIAKAKQKTLLDQGKADPVKLQEEKDKLERQQLRDKAKIEAQIKAVEEASRLRAEAERQKERKAARIALEKVQSSVYFDDNLTIMKKLEELCGRAFGNYCLERLGLYLKDDFAEDDYEDLHLDGEEGEILC